MTLDEELKELKQIEKKLLAIREKKLQIENLKNHLFNGDELQYSMPKQKKTNKRDAISEIAFKYIKQYGNASTHDIVCYISTATPLLLAGRANNPRDYIVAVSQALGFRKDLFKPDRRIGWTLINQGVNPCQTMKK